MAFWRRKKDEDKFSTSILGLDKSIEELKKREEEAEKMVGVHFYKAIEKTRNSMNNKLDTVFESRKKIDEAFLRQTRRNAHLDRHRRSDDDADSRSRSQRRFASGNRRLPALKRIMRNELLEILHHSVAKGVASETEVDVAIKPYVLMVVGVNGVGKTTTIGKLAQRIKNEGNDVLICAADTFRAAASDQLEIWAERAGVPIIQQKQGTDPAAVLFDALKAAKAQKRRCFDR